MAITKIEASQDMYCSRYQAGDEYNDCVILEAIVKDQKQEHPHMNESLIYDLVLVPKSEWERATSKTTFSHEGGYYARTKVGPAKFVEYDREYGEEVFRLPDGSTMKAGDMGHLFIY